MSIIVNKCQITGLLASWVLPLGLRRDPWAPHFRLFFVFFFARFSPSFLSQKWVTFGAQNAPKCPQMVINKCVSTTTYPKVGFWSIFVRFWIPPLLLDERLA